MGQNLYFWGINTHEPAILPRTSDTTGLFSSAVGQPLGADCHADEHGIFARCDIGDEPTIGDLHGDFFFRISWWIQRDFMGFNSYKLYIYNIPIYIYIIMKATKLYLRSPSTIYIDEIRYYWYIPNFLGSHQQQRRHERGSSADHWETLYTCGSHWCTLGSGRQWRFWEKKGTINGFFFEIYGILHGIVNGILWDITWDIYIYIHIHTHNYNEIL